MQLLLENGADPNLPLGFGIGNALCVMATHNAHKIRLATSRQRGSEVDRKTPIQLMDYLMSAGANLTAPVKFGRDYVGILIDFAHATFKSVS